MKRFSRRARFDGEERPGESARSGDRPRPGAFARSGDRPPPGQFSGCDDGLPPPASGSLSEEETDMVDNNLTRLVSAEESDGVGGVGRLRRLDPPQPPISASTLHPNSCGKSSLHPRFSKARIPSGVTNHVVGKACTPTWLTYPSSSMTGNV